VVFKGGILGGVRQFWGNPYLNSTTVLFDSYLATFNVYCSAANDKHKASLFDKYTVFTTNDIN